jgi:hypothetical protein
MSSSTRLPTPDGPGSVSGAPRGLNQLPVARTVHRLPDRPQHCHRPARSPAVVNLARLAALGLARTNRHGWTVDPA